MADRGRGAARGAARGGPAMRGGPRPPGVSHTGPGAPTDKPKREAILDLSKYVNEKIRVKFTGGREGMSIPFHNSDPARIANLTRNPPASHRRAQRF
ncbi:hypothetical protein MD484_g5520, partial [Candolleomyces efflorescens]